MESNHFYGRYIRITSSIHLLVSSWRKLTRNVIYRRIQYPKKQAKKKKNCEILDLFVLYKMKFILNFQQRLFDVRKRLFT